MRCILIALIATAVFPCYTYGQEDRLVVKKDLDDPSRYICDVKFASFKTPSDWRPNSSDKNTYVILTHVDETYPNVTEMISVDIGKPVAPTAKLTAIAFAKTWKGRVLDDKISVDGEEAYRVRVAPTNKDIRPVDCVVVVKGRRVFMLIGGAKEIGGIERSIDEIVTSWKWKQGYGEETERHEQ